MNENEIEIYAATDGTVELEVRLEGDTVWLSQQQIVKLFQSSKANISEHIANVFAEGELDLAATVRDFRTVRQEGNRRVERTITTYNLDVILSVGYRVKSKVATQFRIWATERLRRYVIEGAVLNERRLDEIGQVVRILARSDEALVAGVADVLAGYLPGLTLLRDYDEGSIHTSPAVTPDWTLTLQEARDVIAEVAGEFPSDGLFGRERGDALAGVVATIYQGFAGVELYPTVEEKAANLLYLVVKDHPLSDGNKRSGASLFVTFLARNGVLLEPSGAPRISNAALAAITLMVAMSDPREKELMIALLVRMLADPAGSVA